MVFCLKWWPINDPSHPVDGLRQHPAVLQQLGEGVQGHGRHLVTGWGMRVAHGRPCWNHMVIFQGIFSSFLDFYRSFWGKNQNRRCCWTMCWVSEFFWTWHMWESCWLSWNMLYQLITNSLKQHSFGWTNQVPGAKGFGTHHIFKHIESLEQSDFFKQKKSLGKHVVFDRT